MAPYVHDLFPSYTTGERSVAANHALADKNIHTQVAHSYDSCTF